MKLTSHSAGLPQSAKFDFDLGQEESPIGLSSLPPEIIETIAHHISITDALALRLTSKTLLNLMSCSMSSVFWYLRTQQGDTLGWLMPNELDSTYLIKKDIGDYSENGLRRLATVAATFDQQNDNSWQHCSPVPPIGLRNRWRI